MQPRDTPQAPPASPPEADTAAARALRRVPLPPPRPARATPRSASGPLGRWVRDAERRVSHFLCCHVYPRVPGFHVPYDVQLEFYLTVAEADILLPGLPSGFDNLQVLLITDLHVGPFVSPTVVDRVLGRLEALRPDLVLLGGDILTGRLDDLEPFLQPLRRLPSAPLGAYAVLGNHDHYTGHPDEVRHQLQAQGIEVLHNRAVPLERGGGRLTLAGIDDWRWGKPDMEVLGPPRRRRPDEPPVLLLSHHPDALHEAARRGVSLMLSGHTHGGQIRLPGLPVLVKMSQYDLDAGRYVHEGTELVVSQGLGVTGVPLRLGCMPEVVLLRLRGG